jgi:hypothetical protein
MTNVERFRARLQTARVLWGALVGSTVMFTVLGVTLPVSPHARPAPNLLPIFWVLSLAVAVTSFVLPARQAKIAAGAREIELVPGPPLPGTQRPTVTFANPAAAASSAFAVSNTALILAMALSEAVTLFGFALHMIGGPIAGTLPMSLFGVVLAAARFPTVAKMVGAYERAHGATFAPGDVPE